MKTCYDVVVIGGGPAGSMAALTAADKGLSVLMVERDNTIGSPVRCAEGVDHKGLSEFFEPDPAWIAAEMTGYSLIAPDGTIVEMNIEGSRGYILERVIFDRMVAAKAAEKGAMVVTGVEAVSLSDYEGGTRTVRLRSDSAEWSVSARIVVGADGVESRIARWAGLKSCVSRRNMETCAQVTLAGLHVNGHVFQMHFTRQFAPGGYIWIFPKGSHTANVGLGISGDYSKDKSPREYLNDYLAHRFPESSVVSRTFGGISCTGGMKEPYTDGLLIVGDAAHMANPITGGGIINGMISGKLAGKTAAEALGQGKADRSRLRIYQKRCNNRFSAMNRLLYTLKDSILNIPDERLNEIAREIVALPVEKRTPVRVLTSALKNRPELLLVLARVVF